MGGKQRQWTSFSSVLQHEFLQADGKLELTWKKPEVKTFIVDLILSVFLANQQ